MKGKRETGAVYEKMAGKYLESKGYTILQYNFYCKMGEIDVVALKGNTIVFVEVKYRCDEKNGHPLEAVTKKKQRMICRSANYYLYHHNLYDYDCRFDVIGIVGEEIHWIQNAFMYME